MSYGSSTIPNLGRLCCAHSERKIFSISLGLTEAQFVKNIAAQFKLSPTSFNKEPSSEIFADIEKTFLGEKQFPLERLYLDQGTPFQQKVWKALHAIPFAQTKSYQELAGNLKLTKAVRAVANACGANPFPVIIPCHRVIRKTGALGGFSAGLHYKEKLLAFEREVYGHNFG